MTRRDLVNLDPTVLAVPTVAIVPPAVVAPPVVPVVRNEISVIVISDDEEADGNNNNVQGQNNHRQPNRHERELNRVMGPEYWFLFPRNRRSVERFTYKRKTCVVCNSFFTTSDDTDLCTNCARIFP